MPENYGLLNNMAQGIREGMTTYMTLKNQNRQDSMLKLAQGVQEGENGLEFTPEQKQKREYEMRSVQQKAAEADRASREEDPNSEDSKALRGMIQQTTGKAVPENMSGAQLKGMYGLMGTGMKTEQQIAALEARMNDRDRSFGLRSDATVQRNHEHALKAINDDHQLAPLLTTYQNLENAKQNFAKGGATPQEFAELQQAVRSNAGIKGGSGVGERSDTYLRSLGINKDKFMQFLTGDPQSVLASDPEFAKQILGLVELEQENKKKQAYAQIDKKATGFNTFYHRPGMEDYHRDFQSTIDQFKDQFGAPQKQEAGGLMGKPQEAQAPVIPPQKPGLMSSFMSAIGLNNAHAGAPPALTAKTSAKIQVSNGKETLWIDPADLAHAEKDNYKRIK